MVDFIAIMAPNSYYQKRPV